MSPNAERESSKVPSQDDVTCASCGIPIDETQDVNGVRTPCPQCASTARRMLLRMGPAQFAPYALDNFFAPKLSSLTQCGAPLLLPDEKWLGKFILRSIFEVRLGSKTRAFAFNFMRRAEAATGTYRAARASLVEYLAAPPTEFSPYFSALSLFEVCIAQCYQAYELFAKSINEPLFTKGGGSRLFDTGAALERMHDVYVDSKHMDQMISGDKLPLEATTTVWITNDGLESARSYLSFADLHELLKDLHRVAELLNTFDPTAASWNSGSSTGTTALP